MIGSLPVQYFRWLYGRVCVVRDWESDRSYQMVCDEMQRIPFKVLVAGDENRRSNAADLRDQFLDFIRDRSLDRVAEREAHEVSIFELLVCLSDEARIMTGNSREEWFMIFLQNLGLDRFSDDQDDLIAKTQVRRILSKFNNRRYRANGVGGLFPLDNPMTDQRRIQLWYQLGAYVRQNNFY